MKERVTIHDVASAAQVSIGTVSRALNGGVAVSDHVLARVQAAAATLNYRPGGRTPPANGNGNMLAGRTVALVLLGLDRTLASLPVVAEALHGAESALAASRARVLLVDAPTLDGGGALLAERRLDGVILKGALQGQAIVTGDTPLLRRLRELPSVWLSGRPRGAWGDVVGANDVQAGRVAAAWLLEQGHRRLAFLNPKPDHVLFGNRFLGFRAEAEAAGATVTCFVPDQCQTWSLPLASAHDVECVQGLVDALLAATPRPTAVFTPADSVAALVYRALTVRGRSVGPDLSLMSCNYEFSIVQQLYPTLATVDVYAMQAGRRAVEQLAWRLQHPKEPRMTVALEPRLVIGQSVARAPEG